MFQQRDSFPWDERPSVRKQIVQHTASITQYSRKQQWSKALLRYYQVCQEFPAAAVDEVCRGAAIHSAAIGAQWQEALHLHGGSRNRAVLGATLLALARAKRWQQALQMLAEAGCDCCWG
eukprot:Skav205782  [mRNA]  locus=scaffold340:7349:12103:+ [translate_table: standard]